MTEQLSDSQIDALFEAERDGRLPTAPSRRTRGPRITPIDFARPTTFTKDQERQLRRVHESFCRTTTTALSGETHATVDLEVIGVNQLGWSSAIQEAGTDSIYALIEISPLQTMMMMTLERMFVLALIDRLCGGGPHTQVTDRRLTEIDMMLARRVFQLMVEQLSFVWKEGVGVELAFTEIELDSPGAQIASPAEPALVAAVEIWLDQRSFVLRVMLPYDSIKDATGKFTDADPDELTSNPEQRGRMTRALGQIGIELRAEVARIDVTADQLLAMKVGDIVTLGPAGPITLYADGAAIHRGKPGANGTRRAVQITGGRS